ncbi:MAG TPA: hypothetical protein VMV20_07970, partial [Chitinophagaceae bacterium]|nr:hypothetical protein [Chitinophagaceae bacterium]
MNKIFKASLVLSIIGLPFTGCKKNSVQGPYLGVLNGFWVGSATSSGGGASWGTDIQFNLDGSYRYYDFWGQTGTDTTTCQIKYDGIYIVEGDSLGLILYFNTPLFNPQIQNYTMIGTVNHAANPQTIHLI